MTIASTIATVLATVATLISTVMMIRTHCEKKYGDTELFYEVQILIGNGHYRGAIALCREILEHDLQEILNESSDNPVHYSQSIVRMANRLLAARILDKSGVTAVILFTDIHNEVFHGVADTTLDRARLAAELVTFVRQNVSRSREPTRDLG